MAESSRTQVFISYSRKDKKWLDELRERLAPMVRERTDSVWWDGRITPGQKWLPEIKQALDEARVAVLLVSPAFLASEFILDVELPKILDDAESEGVTILWYLVRKCWWEATPIAEYGAAQDLLKPWNSLSEADLDELLVAISKQIKEALESTLVPPREARAPRSLEAEPAPPEPSVVSSERAEAILAGVDDPDLIDDIGSLFVHRRDWPNAAFAFDRLVEIATPRRQSWMAYGYERLGSIYRIQKDERHALECWLLSRNLYRRIGRPEKAEELADRVKGLDQVA